MVIWSPNICPCVAALLNNCFPNPCRAFFLAPVCRLRSTSSKRASITAASEPLHHLHYSLVPGAILIQGKFPSVWWTELGVVKLAKHSCLDHDESTVFSAEGSLSHTHALLPFILFQSFVPSCPSCLLLLSPLPACASCLLVSKRLVKRPTKMFGTHGPIGPIGPIERCTTTETTASVS